MCPQNKTGNPGPTVLTTEMGIKKVNVSKLGANSNQVQCVPDCNSSFRGFGYYVRFHQTSYY